MSGTGTALIDFGLGSTDTSVTVLAPTIAADSLVESWVFPADTASNTVDNHWVDDVKFIAGNIQAGVGFTIYAKCDTGLAHGVYSVGWVFN